MNERKKNASHIETPLTPREAVYPRSTEPYREPRGWTVAEGLGYKKNLHNVTPSFFSALWVALFPSLAPAAFGHVPSCASLPRELPRVLLLRSHYWHPFDAVRCAVCFHFIFTFYPGSVVSFLFLCECVWLTLCQKEGRVEVLYPLCPRWDANKFLKDRLKHRNDLIMRERGFLGRRESTTTRGIRSFGNGWVELPFLLLRPYCGRMSGCRCVVVPYHISIINRNHSSWCIFVSAEALYELFLL